MNTILLGGAGFIGINLVLSLAKDPLNRITVVDRSKTYFVTLENLKIQNLRLIQSDLSMNTDYECLVRGQDVGYHLISTTVPTTSNQAIAEELKVNVVLSANLF